MGGSYLRSVGALVTMAWSLSATAASLVVVRRPSFQAETEARGKNNKRYWYDKPTWSIDNPLTINL